jgi:hypothetical protein
LFMYGGVAIFSTNLLSSHYKANQQQLYGACSTAGPPLLLMNNNFLFTTVAYYMRKVCRHTPYKVLRTTSGV